MPQLGRDHDVVTVREVPQRAAEDLLARALRVDVRRIEEVDPLPDRVLDEQTAVFLAERPGRVSAAWLAVSHRADRYRRDIQARGAERSPGCLTPAWPTAACALVSMLTMSSCSWASYGACPPVTTAASRDSGLCGSSSTASSVARSELPRLGGYGLAVR